jgi:hypothetical protein
MRIKDVARAADCTETRDISAKQRLQTFATGLSRSYRCRSATSALPSEAESVGLGPPPDSANELAVWCPTKTKSRDLPQIATAASGLIRRSNLSEIRSAPAVSGVPRSDYTKRWEDLVMGQARELPDADVRSIDVDIF